MFDKILHYAEPVIFGSLGLLGLLGVFLVVLVFRKVGQKRFRSQRASNEFLDDVRARLNEKDYDGVVQLCDSPPYWAKAVPQLILVAIANRKLSLTKLTQLVTQRFEREVLAELSYLHLGMAVVAKTAPLIGLLGTVTGIIGSFSVISGENKDPNQLAQEIGLALMATMFGLLIAIPMTLLGGYVMVRIGRLSDEVHGQMSEFLIDLKGQQVAHE
jgi:biopolymer transport protein ExbB/TolQ